MAAFCGGLRRNDGRNVEDGHILSCLSINTVPQQLNAVNVFLGYNLGIMLKKIALWKYGIAVILVLGCCVYVSRQDQEARDQYEQKCSQLNASAVPLSSHHKDCDKGAENAARHLPRWYRVFGWPEGITTWAILLTLLVIADQTAQTKRAAIAAEDAASATRRQSEIASDTAKRQLRAYLCVAEACVKITANENPGGQPHVKLEAQLHIKNGGQTPAYSVQSWLYGHIGAYPENTPVPPPPKGMLRGIAIIPAQGKNIFTAKEIAIFPPIMENLEIPTVPAAYYVQGEVRYRDIYKDWHRLKIRMFYGGPAKTRKTKDSNGVTMGFLGPDSWGNSEEDIPQPEDEHNPN